MSRTVVGLVRRVVVAGDSMAPAIAAGDRLIAVRRWRRLRAGDVVLVVDPREPSRWIVKRCAAVTADAVTLRGDNEGASTDSRSFGDVATRRVRWVVLARRARHRP